MRPKKVQLSVHLVRNPTGARRGIGFLIFPGNRDVTAEARFQEFSPNEKKWMEKSFDWWVSGAGSNNRRFHGWDKSEFGGKYTECFVFKGDDNRLYGFLCHPKKDAGDPRFSFCLLVAHAAKHQWETEEAYLKISEELRLNLDVQKAAVNAFIRASQGKNHEKK